MWKEFYEAVKQLLLLTHQTQQNRDEIKEVRQQVRDLTSALERLAYEVHRLNDKIDRNNKDEVQEREKIALRLENEMLKFERRLLPAKPPKRQKGKTE